MNQGIRSFFFALLRSAISGKLLSDQEKAAFLEEWLSAMRAMAKRHDVSHILGAGLRQNELLKQKDRETENAILQAVYRYEQLNYGFKMLCEAFEKAEIPFLPLKGAVLRQYYTQPWMRTSCDIDILIREEDLDRAVTLLTQSYQYIYRKKNAHDVSLFLNDLIHLELHYALINEGVAQSSREVLKDVWEAAKLKEGTRFWYQMPDEMFYLYHIAHMTKHFEQGGCGIRSFIDLWILDSIDGIDLAKRNALLEKGNLLKFAEAARRLCRVWFEEATHDAISQQMEHYILRGGIYGTTENRITVQQQKKGSKFKYALSKIFISYDVIKFHYPILQKHRWLTPFMQVRRWCKLIFCGHAKRTMRELKYSQNISADKADATREFLTSIGL